MGKQCLFIAAISGALMVMLGAFGAHGLKAHLSEQMMTVWQTAVQYHAVHTLSLLGAGLLVERLPDNAWLRWSSTLFAVGLLLFCGSLYAMALTGITSLGMVTPIGGVAFITAWLCLAMAVRDLPKGNCQPQTKVHGRTSHSV